MATPSYLGQGQPPTTSGGWLSGLFGGTTPAYLGAGQQAAPRTSLFAIAPAYKAAATTNNDAAAPPTQFAIVIPRPQIIDPQE